MEPFTSITAVAVPLDQRNVDTDQIIPARFLGMPRKQQLEGFFHDMRLDRSGGLREGVTLIIVAADNFACGSSRETAVTVMVDKGYRAFVAPSFGDIFFNNCFSNGVLPVRLPADRVARIRVVLHELPGAKISIDLEAQTVVGPDGRTDRFEIDSFRKECLLKGVDSIDLTLGYGTDIAAFEERQRREMSWL
jgi:3-isopropylmalate/(R)-2-methylmalate dehydratase small subunit